MSPKPLVPGNAAPGTPPEPLPGVPAGPRRPVSPHPLTTLSCFLQFRELQCQPRAVGHSTKIQIIFSSQKRNEESKQGLCDLRAPTGENRLPER